MDDDSTRFLFADSTILVTSPTSRLFIQIIYSLILMYFNFKIQDIDLPRKRGNLLIIANSKTAAVLESLKGLF